MKKSLLFIIVCLGAVLGLCKPANATTGYWVLNSNSGYLGFENAGNKSFTFQNGSYSVVSFTNTSPDSLWGAFFVAPNASNISVTKNDDFFMSFAMVWSNPNQNNLGIESLAKSCFASNSQYYAIDDCQVETDVGYNWVGDSRYTESYIYSIHGHFTQNFGWLPSVNLRFRSAGLLASSTTAINVYVTAPVVNIYENREVAADQLVAQRVSELKQQVFELQGVVSNIAANSSTTAVVEQQQQTNNKLDREWEQEQDDRDDMEQQASDVNDAAESSSEDATEAGTTLLAAFSAFVTAITNASPSNCNIDMDLGNLDLGVVNLCQLSLPPALSAIGSILLIAFCVPLSIATATKMIRLFRSFSG